MNTKISKITIVLIFLTVGILGALLIQNPVNYSNNSKKIVTPQTIYNYQMEIENIEKKNKEFYDKIEELEIKLYNYNNNTVDNNAVINVLYNELEKYDIITGKEDLSGPGIEIILSDSDRIIKPGENPNNFIIHNSDILEIINELRSSGAEVIAVNDYALSWNSSINCAGPVIYVDNDISATPFVIKAIGDSEKMYASLESDDSIIELLRYWEINIEISQKDYIYIKSNKNDNNNSYIKIVEEGE